MSMAHQPRMTTTGYVHNLGGLAEPYTLGVQFRKLAWRHFTPPWGPLWSNGILVHLLYVFLQLPDGIRMTAAIGRVHKLPSAPAPGALGVQFLKCAWHLTPW